MTSSSAAADGILAPAYRWVTIGTFALVFLSAFESLAVTTIMPLVSADLDGASLYALAFAGPLATGVIGMVAAGNWADRRGPVAPLYASVAAFVLGLLIAGTAESMPVLVAGRLVQGLGGGAITVALYVVVARVYPGLLHPKIFASFAAAWVLPSLIGPFAAGVVAEQLSWHWVFLGVIGLVVPALAMIIPAMRALHPAPVSAVPWSLGRLSWATLAAAAVLGLNLSAQLPAGAVVLAGVALAIALVALKSLVPRGTLTAMRGLPSVILTRGLASAAFLGTEVYLPYLFIARYNFTPALAGLTLTFGAVAWALASAVQGRMGSRLEHALAIRLGSMFILAATLLVLLTALLHWPAAIAVIGWTVGGAGMGFMYPRLSVMTLSLSSAQNQGFNSSAMSIADSLGAALALAITGIIFTALATAGLSFVGVFGLAVGIAIASVVIAPRVASKQRVSSG